MAKISGSILSTRWEYLRTQFLAMNEVARLIYVDHHFASPLSTVLEDIFRIYLPYYSLLHLIILALPVYQNP
jgi:hypothetical protein